MIWREQYHFTLIPRTLADFAAMCDYYQTARGSHLNKMPICSRLTSDGWVALNGNRLIRHSGGLSDERPVQGGEELARTLRGSFSIDPGI